MTNTPYTEEIDVAQFFVEVHAERGNFSKFEALTHDFKTWSEIDVWDYRRADSAWWVMAAVLEEDAREEATLDGEDFIANIRVTRYPELEKNLGSVDNTYHPSVDSWKIDIDKVRAFLTEFSELDTDTPAEE